MRTVVVTTLMFALALLGGCSQAPQIGATPAKPAEPTVPAEVASVAQSVLGSEAEVLTYGDLARTGRQQALVVNRLPKTPAGIVPGTLVTRAVVTENDGGRWKEVLRCDEYLKNPSGFLGGTPIAPVTGWRLQYELSAEKGLLLYFSPLEIRGSGHPPTIGVRWNTKVSRYQSLDRNFEQFLAELPSLENINSRLK